MKIAVIGGGINGLCSAWALAEKGHKVTLYEKDRLMEKTSAASSKLLHGGLRYLEQFEFSLVREALQERQWWLKHVRHLTRRIPILYPLYQQSRPRWKLKLGLILYDLLAGKKGIGRHRWLSPQQLARCSPQLKQQGLKGAYLFFDGQMQDQQLGLWVADKCRLHGVTIRETAPVIKITPQGVVITNSHEESFDYIVNVAGPWSVQLLEDSGIAPQQSLDLVRGSHLLMDEPLRYGHMLEVPNEKRIVFVLPYQRQTLLGTTEVRQTLSEAIQCSDQERDYLLSAYNHYFTENKHPTDISRTFAGVRPLLHTSDQPSTNSREYSLYRQDKILTVAGGKWTTARALGKAVAQALN
jgi:glycerol-3-phosphate dehydrogenase